MGFDRDMIGVVGRDRAHDSLQVFEAPEPCFTRRRRFQFMASHSAQISGSERKVPFGQPAQSAQVPARAVVGSM